MKRIGGISRRKLSAFAAAAVLLAGGAVAAVTALGEGTQSKPAALRLAGRRFSGRDLAAAATYLGIPEAQLRNDLQSAKSLAEVADATRGKSPAGLIEALVAEKKHHLSEVAGSLTKRVTGEVNRAGGPREKVRGGARRLGLLGRRSLGVLAASYLGLPTVELRRQLREGRTLAQIADATSGKSASGLVQALIQGRREALAAAVASGLLDKNKAAKLGAMLPQRIAKAVNRQLRAR